MSAYYNEINPFAAAWLRELIKEGHIAPGEVDERSIIDIRPEDLRGFNQCHFFAGIGVWSYALRRTGWADDAAIWTGSCPCQPFSAAGKGAGFDDERHLWPHFHYLIEQCQPAVVLGEQVASKDGLAWLDLVQADMEATGYAFGAVDTCAAGFGAPHIRQRLYWIGERGVGQADACCSRLQEQFGVEGALQEAGSASARQAAERVCAPDVVGLADLHGDKSWQRRNSREATGEGIRSQPSGRGVSFGLADNELQQRSIRASGSDVPGGRKQEPAATSGFRSNSGPSPTNGLWGDPDWLFCRDEKWRPVEPGTFPLAHGAPARVGRLRGYGNAINAEQAIGFIEAYIDARRQRQFTAR